MKLLITFLAFMLVCSAADVAGAWNVVVPTRDGDVNYKVVIKQDGESYSGTITADDTLPLTDLKVKGSELSFKVVTDTVTYEVSGTVDGDAMKGKYKVGDRASGEFTAKRIANKTT